MSPKTRHPAEKSDAELLAEATVTRGRTSGPGGQHRNKVETHITLLHRPTGVRAQAGERRSQAQNKAQALARLRLALAVEVRVPLCDGDKSPSARWRGRARAGRIRVSPNHADFGPLLAEALDVLAAEAWEARPAAERLGVSPSQLIKFVKLSGPALKTWNEQRAQLERPPLR